MKILNTKGKKYNVGKVTILQKSKIKLKANEQITLIESQKKEYDICKTKWGYYLTPSMNVRLKYFGYKTFIIFAKTTKKTFIHLVKIKNLKEHKDYLKDQKLKIIPWPKEIRKYM